MKRLEKLLNNTSDRLNLLIKDMDDESCLYQKDSDEKIISASLIKVLIMARVLEEVKRQTLKLSDTLYLKEEFILEDTKTFKKAKAYSIEDLITYMIIDSDNTSTNLLIRHFGMATFNEYAQNLGLTATSLQRYMLDEEAIRQGLNNYTSLKDMYHLFSLLFRHEILDDGLRDKAIAILYKQRCNDQLSFDLPKIPFAHKTGSLPFKSRDTGVMSINGHLYFIGAAIDSKEDDGNLKLMQRLGEAIYDDLNEK